MIVKLSDFQMLNPRSVHHIPTGATFTACPASAAGYQMIVRAGKAGEAGFPALDDLQGMAWALLQETSQAA